jgi:hypothetical protein
MRDAAGKPGKNNDDPTYPTPEPHLFGAEFRHNPTDKQMGSHANIKLQRETYSNLPYAEPTYPDGMPVLRLKHHAPITVPVSATPHVTIHPRHLRRAVACYRMNADFDEPTLQEHFVADLGRPANNAQVQHDLTARGNMHQIYGKDTGHGAYAGVITLKITRTSAEMQQRRRPRPGQRGKSPYVSPQPSSLRNLRKTHDDQISPQNRAVAACAPFVRV